MTDGRTYSAELLCDLIHLETAEVVAVYGEDFYAGTPAVTVNHFGQGKAWYVGSSSSQEFFFDFLKERLEEIEIDPIMTLPEGMEVTRRYKEGVEYTFILNHSQAAKEMTFDQDYVDLLKGSTYKKDEILNLEAKDVLLLKTSC